MVPGSWMDPSRNFQWLKDKTRGGMWLLDFPESEPCWQTHSWKSSLVQGGKAFSPSNWKNTLRSLHCARNELWISVYWSLIGICVYCCACVWTLCQRFLLMALLSFLHKQNDLFSSVFHLVVPTVSLKKLKQGDLLCTEQADGVEGWSTNNLLFSLHHLFQCVFADLKSWRFNHRYPWVWRLLLFYVFPNLKKCSTQPIPQSVISIRFCQPANAPREKHNRIWVALNSEWLLSLVNLLLTRFRG